MRATTAQALRRSCSSLHPPCPPPQRGACADSSKRERAAALWRRLHMSALKEVLPKFGLVYSDRGQLAEVMSKPKLIPIKVETTPCSAAARAPPCACASFNPPPPPPRVPV